MTMFVGAEYVIANMLIARKKQGNDRVSFAELNECGINVQELSNNEDVDAIFLTSKNQLFNAIFDFSDYFESEKDTEDNIVNGNKWLCGVSLARYV